LTRKEKFKPDTKSNPNIRQEETLFKIFLKRYSILFLK